MLWLAFAAAAAAIFYRGLSVTMACWVDRLPLSMVYAGSGPGMVIVSLG